MKLKFLFAVAVLAATLAPAAQARALKPGEQIYHWNGAEAKTQTEACDLMENATRKTAASRDITYVRVEDCSCTWIGIAYDRPRYRCDLSWVGKENGVEEPVPVQQAVNTPQQVVAIAMIPIPGMNYEMGKYEVTQGQWKAIMGNNPSQFSDCGDNCPVENVSWDDVQVFLQKLNANTGKQYRLPNEEEWEYACDGGSKSEYCGGSDLNAVGWYEDNSKGKTHTVGFKKPNGYGLYDMSGNVWEWSSDKYKEGEPNRVLRGGSWYHGAQYARAARRGGFEPAGRDFSFGFRLARTLP
jgi:formylglycine-generating enzyme required for sulfatase activity